jgi:hypothetical protein
VIWVLCSFVWSRATARADRPQIKDSGIEVSR